MSAANSRSGAAAKRAKAASGGSGATRRTAAQRRPGGARRRRAATAAAAAPAPRPTTRVAMVAGMAVALAAAFHVWTGVTAAELGYQRSRAIELSQRLEVQRQELADELAGLLRTEYLEEESARRLGLGLPTAGQVVDLRRKQLASVPQVEP